MESVSNPYFDTKWYHEIIMYYLDKFTNINKIFKTQEMNFLDLNYVLSELIDCPKELILNEFLLKINEQYILIKDSYGKEQKNVIMYTNLTTKLIENEWFMKLLNNFDLEIFSFREYNFKEENEENTNFNSKYLMIKYSEKTRDWNLLKSHALNEIYSFFGYLTYVTKFNKTTTKTHINELTLNNEVSDLKCNAMIITNMQKALSDLVLMFSFCFLLHIV